MLTNVPTLRIVLVERIGISTSEMAMHVPSGHSMGVVVEVDVLTVRMDRRVEVVVMVVRTGFVAMGVEAARATVATLERSDSHLAMPLCIFVDAASRRWIRYERRYHQWKNIVMVQTRSSPVRITLFASRHD